MCEVGFVDNLRYIKVYMIRTLGLAESAGIVELLE